MNSSDSNSSFRIRNVIKQALKHWGPISALLGISGAGFGLLCLYSYCHAIGRPGLVLEAIDAGPALMAWLLAAALAIPGYLFLLTAPTWLYGIVVGFFERYDCDIRNVANWLLVPVIGGFLVFIAFVFYLPHTKIRNGGLLVMLVVFAPVGVGVYILSKRRTFAKLMASSTPSEKRLGKLDFWFLIPLILSATVLSALFPVRLILSSYVGEDSKEAVLFVALISFATLVFSLIPAYVFFTAKGGGFRRLTVTVVVLAILFVVFLLGTPGPLSRISYAAAGNLEIREDYTSRFVLGEHTRLEELDSLLWHTRQAQDARVEVEAYQLFAMGEVLLLCPSSLLNASLYQLAEYTRYCLLTSRSEVHRKPRRRQYPLGSEVREPRSDVSGWLSTEKLRATYSVESLSYGN